MAEAGIVKVMQRPQSGQPSRFRGAWIRVRSVGKVIDAILQGTFPVVVILWIGTNQPGIATYPISIVLSGGICLALAWMVANGLLGLKDFVDAARDSDIIQNSDNSHLHLKFARLVDYSLFLVCVVLAYLTAFTFLFYKHIPVIVGGGLPVNVVVETKGGVQICNASGKSLPIGAYSAKVRLIHETDQEVMVLCDDETEVIRLPKSELSAIRVEYRSIPR